MLLFLKTRRLLFLYSVVYKILGQIILLCGPSIKVLKRAEMW